MEMIAAVTSLVSVLISGTVAILTVRHAASESKRRRVQEFALAVMPRRLESIQMAWLLLFELEASREVPRARADRFIESSIWLPRELRSRLIEVLTRPSILTDEVSGSLRAGLEAASGAILLQQSQDSIATYLAESPRRKA